MIEKMNLRGLSSQPLSLESLLYEIAVVFAGGGEDVEDFGGLEGGGLMLDVAVDDEAVSGVGVEDFAVYIDADGSADDVDELVVGVAVAGSDPALLEVVADEHELVSVGEDLALHAGFGGEGFGILVFYQAHVGFLFYSLDEGASIVTTGKTN
jgi:hypothetical protein